MGWLLIEKKPGRSDPGCLKRVYFPFSLHCLIAHGSQECFPVKAGLEGPQSSPPAPCLCLLGRKELFPALCSGCQKGTFTPESQLQSPSSLPEKDISRKKWIHHKVLSVMSNLPSDPRICNLCCFGAVGGRWAHSPFPFDSAFS